MSLLMLKPSKGLPNAFRLKFKLFIWFPRFHPGPPLSALNTAERWGSCYSPQHLLLAPMSLRASVATSQALHNQQSITLGPHSHLHTFLFHVCNILPSLPSPHSSLGSNVTSSGKCHWSHEMANSFPCPCSLTPFPALLFLLTTQRHLT